MASAHVKNMWGFALLQVSQWSRWATKEAIPVQACSSWTGGSAMPSFRVVIVPCPLYWPDGSRSIIVISEYHIFNIILTNLYVSKGRAPQHIG